MFQKLVVFYSQCDKINLSDQNTCIRVDRLRFSQIFFNLLSNAAKFTPTGGTVEFLSESLEPRGEKAGIRFTIRDNGVGMSQEFMDHMYDPFSQERSALGDTVRGTGAIRRMDRPDAPEVPIIAMTADAFDEERRNTLEAGMDYHLSKPINPPILYKVLTEYIQ